MSGMLTFLLRDWTEEPYILTYCLRWTAGVLAVAVRMCIVMQTDTDKRSA